MKSESRGYGFEVEFKGATQGLVSQVHGCEIAEAGGLPSVEADAIFTRKRGETVFVFTADCLPVLFLSPGTVAAVHAGWRGAKDGIVKKTAQLFTKENLSPEIILGPCLMPCCFEVKADFIESWERSQKQVAPFLTHRDGKWFFDLPRYVVDKELADMPAENINQTELRCTRCSLPLLPSYRRNGRADPRIKAWARLPL